ncbi:GntR family transcriptional regulator [Microvirga lotononidis]|uniref:Transcriptional regulator n=1 Tax=Microvirga lotononidis TaxID=864069 RepID=I4YYC9_9HYPH|nr:GntR family transcriptional regulator [Microvirga lotononidis]EIM28971.1 transcriptional regulator [Microvirga lotononidis]WQO26887.1 GntR family transcriptional regulator [Microvirga lotononidis]
MTSEAAGLPVDEFDSRGPILRPTLHDAIVARVRDMIIEGELAAGTRLHEGNLGKLLGVSRTPLREALKFLVSEGLLELSPGRGAVVRQFTAKDVHDSLIVLGNLEGLAGRLACEHATDAEIGEVRQLHDRMMDMYEKRDRLPYFKLNQSIHSAILRLSKNEALVSVHSVLQARLKRIRYIGNEGPEKWAGAVADHEEMIAALEARDADRLSKILNAHMEKTWERVRHAI